MHGATVSDAHTCSNPTKSSVGEEPAWSGHKFNMCKPSFTCEVHVNVQPPQENIGLAMLSVKEELELVEQADELPFPHVDEVSFPNKHELPSIKRLVGILQNCRRMKDLVHAERTLVQFCNHGLEAHGMVGNYLVPLFVDCGSMENAHQIFTRLAYRNEHSWTSLIQGFMECGKSQHALDLLQKMHMDHVCPSMYTFVALLKACARLKSMERAQEVHVEIVKEEFERELFVGSTLVDMYVKCGSLINAKEVFEELPVRNVVSWNALIAGYAGHGFVEEVQICLEKMEADGISPDSITFAFCLKACANSGSIQRGRKLHAGIATEGLESVPFLGNALLDMYAKFGLLLEAQEVFDNLPVRDVVPWTSLMTGYAENRLCDKALDCMKQMQLEGVVLDSVTFVCTLKVCGSTEAIDKGQETHAEIVKEGLERDLYTGNALVDMYVKCSLLAEAREVINELPVRDVFSWTALITGYAEKGFGEDVLNCLEQMQSENIFPNSITYVCCVKACGSGGALLQGRELHAEISKDGYEIDLFVGNTLVDMYAKCGSLEEAQEVFDNLPVRDVVSWTVLIAGYAECGCGEEALNCMDQMQVDGLPLDDFTFVCCLKAVGSTRAISRGQEIHIEIVKAALEREPFVGNALVDMYAKCGSFDEAREVFEKLPARDVVSWNTLVSEYAENCLAKEALHCLEQMKLEGLIPDRITFVSILKVCTSVGAIHTGLEVYLEIVKTGFEGDPFVGNTLLDMYAKYGLLVEAQEIFDRFSVKDVVTWNAVIAGYVECEFAEEALKYLEHMKLEGVLADAVTFLCSLRACGNIGVIARGQELHAEIARDGYENDPHIGNALIDMYARCCSLAEASEVFDELQDHDVVSWNVLIAGYAEQGLCKEVLSCLEQMRHKGVSPNVGTFVCSLKVCRSLGNIDKGQEIHAEIVEKGYDSDPFVGNLLVDMYAKCGLVREAQETFDKLQDPDTVSWTALIAGYAECGLGDDVLYYLEQMQLNGLSPGAATFVCSLKGCGGRGQLQRGQRVHIEIVKEGFEIDPLVGNTLVDMYAKCGLFVETQQVLNKMPDRDVVSWNTLIAAYVDHDLCEDALKCVEQMRLEGVSPDAVTLACGLKAGGITGCLHDGQASHMDIVKKGFERDSFVGNTLVDMYAKCGALTEAHEVFDKLINADVFSWNALIAGYAEYGLKEEALNLFEQMKWGGLSPDAVTYACSMKACESIGTVNTGWRLHAEAVIEGFENDLYLGNTLVAMYAKCGLLTEARGVFEELPVRDVVSWNTLVAGYVEQGLGEEALDVLDQMQSEGMPGDAVTSVCCLKACGSIGAIEKGREFHAKIVKEASERMSFIGNSLVDMYGKCGSMADAWQMFDTLPERELVTWNALITGYARQGEIEFVSYLLERMRKEGTHPNEITFLSVLTLCSHLGLVDKGHDYLEVMRKEYGLTLTLRHYNCLVDILSRAGQLDQAVAMLEGMQYQPDPVTWSTMLGACLKWGNVELGREAFQNLTNLDANHAATFILMSNMYADAQIQKDGYDVKAG